MNDLAKVIEDALRERFGELIFERQEDIPAGVTTLLAYRLTPAVNYRIEMSTDLLKAFENGEMDR